MTEAELCAAIAALQKENAELKVDVARMWNALCDAHMRRVGIVPLRRATDTASGCEECEKARAWLNGKRP